MSPQDVAGLMTLLSILKQMSGWPFGAAIFAVVIGPWLFAFLRDATHRKQIRIALDQYRQDVSEIKRLYESNSRLVDDCTKAFCRLDSIYSQTIDIISLNTQTQTELVESIKGNQYCPIVRRKGGPEL